MTQSDAKMYVIDTDRAAARVVPDMPEDQIADVWDWDEYGEALVKFGWDTQTKRWNASPDDWLVLDLADKPWTAVQDWYTEKVYGKNSAQFFLDYKVETEGGAGNPLSDAYGSNWTVINKNYNDFINKVLRWPGHTIACAPSDPINRGDKNGKGADDNETLGTFGRYNVKPGGQKRLGFQFLTVLLMIPGNNEWRFTSIKDVGLGSEKRDKPQNKVVKDFVKDYLVEVARWTL